MIQDKEPIAVVNEPEKKKRGRKKLSVISNASNTGEIIEKPPPKKRGRKPKGGKLVDDVTSSNKNNISEPNVILHLKCSISDITNTITDTFNYNPNIENIESFSFNTNTISELHDATNNNNNNGSVKPHNNGDNVDVNEITEDNCKQPSGNNDMDIKSIWTKLNSLKLNLHNNIVTDKHSACFWCTYQFDNPPIYLPKYEYDNSYHVYGCFCSPECSIGFLMNEKIDSSVKFERYQLANQLYGNIFNYKQNIKPAPNPYYLLDKFYGNLSINEYRKILSSQQLLMVVEKPLTHILPELYEDNNEFILNHRTIPSNTNLKLTRKSNNIKKNTVLDEFVQSK